MKLWGKRFEKAFSQEAFEFSASLAYDSRLAVYDIAGSVAHAGMLGECGILTADEVSKITSGLEAIRAEIEAAWERAEDPFDYQSEDIHTEIERRLAEKIGDLAGKLHTARSRNDQVALDLHMYVVDLCLQLNTDIVALQKALLGQAAAHLKQETLLPGYTHRQHAQPVLLAHHLLAYFWKLERDRTRLLDCGLRANVSPLGAAALAGTSFPINPEIVAETLEFSGVYDNSMDAVSDRDFIAEFLSCAAICMTHLSSLAGEVVLWSSPEFGFVKLDDAWCTGSSIMPQKRNPDIAELVHGKAGRVFGHLAGLLVLLKGLPLTYNRDLQEDKEALFDTEDTLQASLQVLAAMLETAAFQPERMRQAATSSPYAAATEVADYLVRKGVGFREAHGLTAKIVRDCENSGRALSDLSPEDWRKYDSRLEADIVELLAPAAVVRAKTSPGGTAPARVQEALAQAQGIIDEAEELTDETDAD